MAVTTTRVAQRVPFLDLTSSHQPLKARILEETAKLIDSNAFTNGPHVSAFEDAWAEYCGTQHCVGMASGLDALRLTLIAAGLEPGDEVIVPAMTFIATFEAVTQAGGTPVPVDVSESDYCIDVDAIEAAITPRTRFIVPVHLYGQMADMVAINRIAQKHGLFVLEDACQAHGAQRDGLIAGDAGDAAAFSFYPGKNLGAMGDAGAVTTDDDALARELFALREHGESRKYEHYRVGWTSRLDAVQALVLLEKLQLLDRWNDARRSASAFYATHLRGAGDLVLPQTPDGSSPSWHVYVVRTANPEALAHHLALQGVSTARHYPQPAHRTAAYEHLGGSFPIADDIAKHCLSLPLFPGISAAQLTHVTESIASFFR